MNRLKLVFLSVVALNVFCSYSFGQKAAKQPNIILIMSDDIGYLAG